MANTTESALAYMKSSSGTQIIFQAIISLTTFIIIVTEKEHPGAFKFFAAICFLSFAWALLSLVGHFIDLRQRFSGMPWLIINVLVDFLFVGLLFIGSTLVAAKAQHAHAGSAATLGFLLTASYCKSMYLDIKIYRAEETPYETQENPGPEYPAAGQQDTPPQYEPAFPAGTGGGAYQSEGKGGALP